MPQDQANGEIEIRQRNFSNKGRRFPAQPLTKDEVCSILDQFNKRYFTGQRDHMVCVLMWRAQMRISEVLALRPEDIELDQCSARVLHGKGDKARVAAFDEKTADEIREWLVRREKEGFGGNDLLFCTSRGKPLNSGHFRNKLKRLAKKSGAKKRIHPHNFRHTGATEMLREGVNLRIIQGQLGHSNISTTYNYVRHLCPQEQIETMKRREW